MEAFGYVDGALFAEEVALTTIAEQFGTPTYVYSRRHIEQQYRRYADALSGGPHLICYAVKANSNLAILGLLARLGAGFDIVSGGELARVLAVGGDAGKVVFSGVGKSAEEIRQAITAGILCFNVESAAELDRIEQVARQLGQVAPVSIRVNPDVDPGTHPYISTGLKENKFGVDAQLALALYQQAAASKHLRVVGMDCHIGSQITTLSPFLDALEQLLKLVDRFEELGIVIDHLDLGGGLGVCYKDETSLDAADYVAAVRERLAGRNLKLLFEPGRYIAANAGVLLTRVEYLKPTAHKHFAVVDAAMNDLIRPALYQAWMTISPVQPRAGQTIDYDVVGPICETGDFLGQHRSLCIAEGDLLVVHGAGAYGFSMSSNYNSRPRAAEVLVDGERPWLIRKRESVADLYAGESRLPD